MEKITGYLQQSGEFNGLKYNNYVFTAQFEPNPAVEHKGVNCKQYKVKGSYMEEILKRNNLQSLDQMVGREIENPYSDVLYDANQKIKLIILKK